MNSWIVRGAKGEPRGQLDLVEEMLRRGFRSAPRMGLRRSLSES